jgi:hypothetical protein
MNPDRAAKRIAYGCLIAFSIGAALAVLYLLGAVLGYWSLP